uniref:DnaJ homolog subfamily C member 3 n=1 Tax=Phallusia mammillata TaxID=59560 RepID=A0A6F9DBD5_9ASCI|nr:dnaJ homolog subfamily C member 3 [Phallusia mammillata]
MMKDKFSKIMKHLISQVPIMLVLLDLHFEGIEGLDKAESQKLLSKGNQLLNAGQLAEALSQYHSAIDSDGQNYQAYYMRATVYLAMGKARSALPDLNQVVSLRPTFVKARMQRGNLFLKMGKFNEAQGDYEFVLAHEDNAMATAKVEEIRPLRRNVIKAQKLIEENDNAQAIPLLNEVIESCPWNPDFRELRATAYEQIGDLRRAISDLKPTTMLRLDNTRAFLKMSILWYSLGEIDQSLDEIRECLKLDPDHRDCYAHYKSVKKLFKTVEAGKRLMEEKNYPDAIGKFEKALAQESRVTVLSVDLKLKICECYVKDNKVSEAIDAADEVLALEPNNIPALFFLSEAHTQEAEYEQALEDLQKAAQIDENYPGLNEKIQKAQKLLKQSQKRDYYKILGVSRNAKKKDIIKAYRNLAREWHPDNFQDEKEKQKAEKRFIEIAAAKEVLSDPEKRKKFDAGVDPLDPEENQNGGRGHGFNPFGQGGFKFHFGGQGGGGPFGDFFHDEF